MCRTGIMYTLQVRLRVVRIKYSQGAWQSREFINLQLYLVFISLNLLSSSSKFCNKNPHYILIFVLLSVLEQISFSKFYCKIKYINYIRN